MNTEAIEDELLTNGNRKINIGLRVYPEIKLKLVNEAENLGLTLSEYCENILLNKDLPNSDLEEAEREIERLEKEAEKHHEEIVASNKFLNDTNAKLNSEIAKLTKETNVLKRKALEMEEQLSLFSDKRLWELFSKLKGQKDIIECPNGQKVPVTYNTPMELLKAMIYSFKLKK